MYSQVEHLKPLDPWDSGSAPETSGNGGGHEHSSQAAATCRGWQECPTPGTAATVDGLAANLGNLETTAGGPGVANGGPDAGGGLPEGRHPADAGGGGAYPCLINVSQETPYVLADTSFGGSGERRSVVLAGCGSIECGSAPWCYSVCVQGKRIKRMDVPEVSLEDKLKWSRQRSARSVADLVRASQLDHLLTMTAGCWLGSRQDALDAFSGYLNDKRYGRWFKDVIDGKYVVVAEPFKTGDGWHIHAAISGRLRPVHLERLKVTWTGYLYQRLHIPRPDTPKRLWRVRIDAPGKYRSPKALGAYLGKYITKDFSQTTLGERRYRCGQGLTRPTVTRTVVYLTEQQARALFNGCERVYDVYTPDGRHVGWTAEMPSGAAPPNAGPD